MTDIKGEQFIMLHFSPKGKLVKQMGKITGSDYTNIVIAYGKISLRQGFTHYKYDSPCGYYSNANGERMELWTEENYKRLVKKVKSK